ncbi:substrate-binding domain-containing protein [Celeribacter marinus]|uniref:Inositol transport system sugar-binding protein n=1 Tax=Celeribacter marinus TaxID=1397108 RepID=A0A0P0ACI0_9RHOB|nr:substrate-binding domain-containing protein [Celeribacter marinus]ALI56540.1 inositol transport system sugar-binding protein [Celeribacter marinus]SFK40344.1 monosaccharide ABC transporter substrate-binding protein, CUT2 family [Celeribacter marinus]
MTILKGLLASAAVVALSTTVASAADIAIIGGKSDDSFFAKIKKGIDDATLVVEAHGGKVNYLQLQTYDNIGGDAANLVRTAISQEVDIIAVPNWVPDTQDEAIKAAMDAGIPVILYNAGGGDKAKELGAINYIGNEEYPAGLAGGRYFAAHGAKNVICVNTVPGAGNLEDRCRGIADGMAESGFASKQLPLPASSFGDPTAVAEAIKATLIGDDTIDGVFAISSADADSAFIALQQAGKANSVSLGSFDMNVAGLERIRDEEQLFAIDQQPWLQGFLAVTLADGYVNYGLAMATTPLLTGPGIVDSANIAATLKGGEQGYR